MNDNTFIIVTEPHIKGDGRCPACHEDYPDFCDCGGILHGELNITTHTVEEYCEDCHLHTGEDR